MEQNIEYAIDQLQTAVLEEKDLENEKKVLITLSIGLIGQLCSDINSIAKSMGRIADALERSAAR